ncbi:MAG: hypothetical protein Kow00123_18470 [Anaerolineales bacterium]
MSVEFSRESPVVQEIMSLLREHADGLRAPEIRRALVRRGRPGVQERDIGEIALLPEFRRLPDGRIVLREMEGPTPDVEEDQARPDQAEEGPHSTLCDLPSLDSYVIFDLETNGLDPSTADFFQISAIRVKYGQPVAAGNWYARVPTSGITRALRDRLHFDELGLEAVIEAAGTQQEALAAFRAFAGNLPLVAHNGTFDIAFLRKHDPNLPNTLVDSLELVCLAFPAERSHSLEHLAERLGLAEKGARWHEVRALDEALGVSASLGAKPGALFHWALFDCLILHVVLQHALAQLRALSPDFKAHMRRLSAALGDLVGAPESPTTPPAQLDALIHLRDWSQEVPPARLQKRRRKFSERAVMRLYGRVVAANGWRPRPAQREMVRRVTRLFARGGAAMIEAPTGTGKTIAYALPAIAWARTTGEQVVLSTSTKVLQDQLVNDLETKVGPALRFPFRFAVLKGQENYLCLTKLWAAFLDAFWPHDDAEAPFEEKLALLYLLRYAEESPDGDLQNTSFWFQQRFPVMNYLKAALASERETCGAACEFFHCCFHPRAKAIGDSADLLIVNHALLLMRSWDEERLLNVVLDEAHNLEDVATSILTEEASRERIEHLLARLLRADGKRGALIRARAFGADAATVDQAMGCVRRLRNRVREFGGYLRAFVEGQGVQLHPKYGASWRFRAAPRRAHYFAWEKVDQPLREILQEIDRLAKTLDDLMAQLGRREDDPRAQGLMRELQSVRGLLVATSEQPGQRLLLSDIPKVGYDPLHRVHWIELAIREGGAEEAIPPQRIDWAFKRAPVRVSQHLEEKVYQHTRALLLTSATLTLAEGAFNFFLDRLGLETRIPLENLVTLPKEFKYAEQVLLGMPGYLRTSARYDEIERFQEEMARELDCLFRFTEGRGLVLHTARSRMEFVAEHLEKSLTHLPVYWQREGISKQMLKEEFANREESVLLGVRSFWEGIDVPGPSLSYLVIEKLPFPVPTEPIVEARREEVRSRGGSEWMDYLIPLAALHFKQGFGRLMRKHDDRGVVIFMDKRLRTDAFYREAVLGSLPGYKRTDDLIEAEDNRASFYEAIAGHMAQVFPWDWAERLNLFPCIREEILPDLERQLVNLRIPQRVDEGEYGRYRDNLVALARELIPGFQGFRPEQDEAMRSILAGRDTLVVLPTGSGKSLTFQLPALLRDGVTLVFSPLIALMRDQVDRLRGKGLTVVDYIVSGQSGAHRDQVYRRMAKGELRLVYIAPERIRDPALAEALAKTQITQVVVDEAHCVYMWGPNFRPDFLHIPDLFAGSRPPMAALTATATPTTREAIAEALHLTPDFRLVTRTVNRPELKFIVYNQNSSPDRIRSKQDKLRVLIKILRAAQQRDEVALVYTATVREAERLSRLLDLRGFTVRCYHGRMAAQAREEVQELFREGIVKIIVATKAFGMGIDKADVRYVIHYDIPGDLESYFQEAGRAGRDGKTAYCVLLYHKNDLKTQQYFIEQAFPSEAEIRALASSLQQHVGDRGQILVRPETLAEESDVDIERLDVALHLLEQLGMVRRLQNFTLTANVLLNRSPRWLVKHLPQEQGRLLSGLVRATGLSDKRGKQLDLLDVSATLGADPLDVDSLLTALSVQGWAVYRPWERGYVLEASERLGASGGAPWQESEVAAVKDAMRINLRRMQRYAESLGHGDCRRRFILEYFEERGGVAEKGCCDLCERDMPVPWRDIPDEEGLDIAAATDPAYIVLRAVQWNESLRKVPFRQPYSTTTLGHILLGNGFAAVKNEADRVRRLRRLKRLEDAPYYGVLDGLKRGQQAIKALMAALQDQGYVRFENVTIGSTNGWVTTYQVPVLEEKGRRQIQSGQYLEVPIDDP